MQPIRIRSNHDYGGGALMRDFVNLHVHSDYSLADGVSTVSELMSEAQRLGQPAIGLTDHGSVGGLMEFWKAGRQRGIKPILGVEAYVTPETGRTDTRCVSWDNSWKERNTRRSVTCVPHDPYDVSGGGLFTHLTLWAESDEGLVNLMKASSVANLEGLVSRYPRMDNNVLSSFAKGLICGSGCMSGAIPTRLLLGQFDEALRMAGELQDIFGRDNFFIEIMDHGLSIEHQIRNDLVELAKRINAPLVATSDVHYAKRDDSLKHDVRICIETGDVMDGPHRFKFESEEYYLRSSAVMRSLFSDVPEACDNTLLIAERCDTGFCVAEDGSLMPQHVGADGRASSEILQGEVEGWLQTKYGSIPDSVWNRAQHEMAVIRETHAEEYLMAVAYCTNRLREEGHLVGPGKGILARSLVAYALGISEIDPIEYDLPFTDFQDSVFPTAVLQTERGLSRRVLQYLCDRYGNGYAAAVIAYSRFNDAKAVKDVSHVCGYQRFWDASSAEVWLQDNAKKSIADGLKDCIYDCSVRSDVLALCNKPLAEVTSIVRFPSGAESTAFNAKGCDELGLPRLRIAGSRVLQVVQDALRFIPDCNVPQVWDDSCSSLDESRVYDLLSAGYTAGIPFLDGMKSELMQQKLTSFAELIDICHSRGADRADAVARAMFAYRVAYVKTLYTIEFMTAMLNSYNEDGARAKLESIFEEMYCLGIHVRMPNINQSQYYATAYSSTGDDEKSAYGIQLGFNAIRGISEQLAEEIVSTRNKGSAYRSFNDFIRRVSLEHCNAGNVNYLIRAGAFDCVNPCRKALAQCGNDLIEAERQYRAAQSHGQGDLLQDVMDASPCAQKSTDEVVPNGSDWDQTTRQQLQCESFKWPIGRAIEQYVCA